MCRFAGCSRSGPSPAWDGWPDIPTLEEARLAWFDATEQPAQQAAARRIQRLVMEEAPYLPTGQYFSSGAMRRNLDGALTAILGVPNGRLLELPVHLTVRASTGPAK